MHFLQIQKIIDLHLDCILTKMLKRKKDISTWGIRECCKHIGCNAIDAFFADWKKINRCTLTLYFNHGVKKKLNISTWEIL